MRILVCILLFFAIGRTTAQETTLVLSDSMYHNGAFRIAEKEGWLYKPGKANDAQNINLDTKGWRRLKPSELSGTDFDKNGRLEGWFRIKVKFQDTSGFIPPGIFNLTWMAAEVFANGKRIAVFGKPGSVEDSFAENKYNRKLPIQTTLQADSTYVLALHVVDYKDPLAISPRLKSEKKQLELLLLTNKDFNQKIVNFWAERTFYDGLLSAVSAIFALLFWILFWLNRKDRKLMHFAVGCSLLALLSICVAISTTPNLDYIPSELLVMIGTNAILSYVFYIPILLASVFNIKIGKLMGLVMVVAYLMLIVGHFLQVANIVFIGTIPIGISAYYLISSWNRLRGSQWAVVTGYVVSFIFLVVYVWTSSIGARYVMVYMLIYTVSPPLGMLIYVASRFGEMMKEVRMNAAEVVRLSEEKSQQALNQQKILQEEVERQTSELRQTLTDLKQTQSQLIQSEKMASLGELTAGIAHEIQNPLNFVNNFSDVSMELLDEVSEERNKKQEDRDAGLEAELLSDIRQNLEKIAHHGRRADSIVKGMLQHSRTSSGDKELTDVNALTDEYLRLAYHGLRAKDKSFNAALITNFDPNLPKVKMLAQDVGRVLLNLLTNAFYATQKQKLALGDLFEPTVEVSTALSNNVVEIKVKDNGGGIPENIKEKIFQPFFTTKPTGEGTGLGLSLAYDIIKSHGGEIRLATVTGEATEFTIVLNL